MRFLKPLVAALVLGAVSGQPGWGAEPQRSEGSRVVKDLNTPREFPEITTRKAWDKRAREIREQILVSCGLWPMPAKTPLEAHIFGRVERDGYSIEKVYFQALPGFYLAGNLYRPVGQGRGPFPGIINPHGHSKLGRLNDDPQFSTPARCISFARQGMVAFAYDMVGYNDTHFPHAPTNRPFYEMHRQFATNRAELLCNINLMGLQTWDSIRALDFMESLPDVDRRRLACTGESGGGTQTYMLGAVDDRLAAQAPVVMVSHTMQGGCSCENAPGLRVEYSNMEIAAAAAPRPQLLVAATGDWTKDTLAVEGPAIQHIYELFHAADKLRYVRFNFGHNYNQTSREAVYGWFGRWLLRKPEGVSLREQPYQKEEDANLRLWPDGSLPADAVSQAELIQWLIRRSQAQLEALSPTNARTLARFKKVILPAWRHIMQVGWPAPEPCPSHIAGLVVSEQPWEAIIGIPKSGGGAVEASYRNAGTVSPARLVVLAAALGSGPGSEEASKMSALAGKFAAQGCAVVTIRRFSTGEPPDQFTNFFSVYNRTKCQERVGNLVRVCSYARDCLKARKVVLCGSGVAGLWALLAASGADAVIADCNQLDVASDEGLLAPDLFCPGLRKIGAFEGAAMLAAPHPVLLHNAGASFATGSLRSAYQGLGAAARLRVESRCLSEEELGAWVEQVIGR